MNDKRDLPLLQWQRSLYEGNHRRRSKLLVHAITNPMFMTGTALVVSAPLARPINALLGVALAAIAMALQGRTPRAESVAPVPFAAPFDALARIFAEQWVTFPWFVIDGGFARAWRESSLTSSAPSAGEINCFGVHSDARIARGRARYGGRGRHHLRCSRNRRAMRCPARSGRTPSRSRPRHRVA